MKSGDEFKKKDDGTIWIVQPSINFKFFSLHYIDDEGVLHKTLAESRDKILEKFEKIKE